MRSPAMEDIQGYCGLSKINDLAGLYVVPLPMPVCQEELQPMVILARERAQGDAEAAAACP